MIIRSVVTFAVCITLGRWGYAEIEKNIPGLTPAIDYVLEAATIPTYDTWDKEKMSNMFETLGEVKSAFASDKSLSDYSHSLRESDTFDRF